MKPPDARHGQARPRHHDPGGRRVLLFEGLRIIGESSRDAFEAGIAVPEGLTLLDVTDRPTHPSPYRRLARLRDDAVAADPDGSEATSIAALWDGFNRLLPAIERNMPEHRLTDGERAAYPPGVIPEGATIHGMCLAAVAERLDAIVARGEPTAEDAVWFLDAIERVPRTVLDALVDGLRGKPVPGVTANPGALARALGPLADMIGEPHVRTVLVLHRP